MHHYCEYTEHVLALFPHAKGVGFAFFQVADQRPDHAGIVCVKRPDNDKCMKRINELVRVYQPKIILIPTPDGKQNRKKQRVQELLAQIERYGKKHQIIVKMYSREQVRSVFERYGAHSKFEIAGKICEEMPHLERHKPRYRKAYMCEDYHQAMFDAISLFVTHRETMRNVVTF